jgi:ABC-type dipeptide/oligopeptide/nickel transport system ATPase component
MKNDTIIEIRDLTVDFETIDGVSKVLQGVNLIINQGEVVGVVGETGCGKSVTAKTLLGILPIPPARVRSGEIYFLGDNLLKIDKTKRELVKRKVAYVPQDPMASLNPVFSIGSLMVDMIIWNMSDNKLSTYLWKRRKKTLRGMAENYAMELLEKVRIPNPKCLLGKYAMELRGGMRKRVVNCQACMLPTISVLHGSSVIGPSSCMQGRLWRAASLLSCWNAHFIPIPRVW